jgi:hypothetical protein
MAPCDFWLFPKLKRPLKCSHFDSREDIMRNTTKELSRNASSSGRNVGLSVWSHKGPTLNGITNWAPPPRYATFFSWPKVRYLLDRVVYICPYHGHLMRYLFYWKRMFWPRIYLPQMLKEKDM